LISFRPNMSRRASMACSMPLSPRRPPSTIFREASRLFHWAN
jgi:hypothetical protein